MVENWTKDEEIAISNFRKLIKHNVPTNVYEDQHLLYKFLKARYFNLLQAETMLLKNVRWRKEWQVDTLKQDYEPPEVLKKYISQNLFGFDKQGCLIHYSALGNLDGKGIFKSANFREVVKCCLQELEKNITRLKCHSKKLGRNVNQCVYIYNMEGFTLSKAAHKGSIRLFTHLVTLFQDNYPEMLKTIYIVNASVYFTIVFPIVKAILTGALLDKIKVFGKTGWKEELLNTIDADLLPAFLGGTRTDPDGNPSCRTFVNSAGMIPESYYLTKDTDIIAKKNGSKYVEIERHCRCCIPIPMSEPGSILHWEFETKTRDIGFGLQMETCCGSGVEDADELIPVHKVETEVQSETGMYRCAQAGTYFLIFDNTFSWFYSKELYYRTWVTYPDDQDKNIDCDGYIDDY